MKLAGRCSSAAALWLALVSCDAKAQPAKIAQLDAYLEQAHQAGLLNGDVLIADHGKVILRRALGHADSARTVPLSLSDRFDIGSIAKEFDAVGLLMLVEEGKLSLTDPVSKFFPDLPAWAATVTGTITTSKRC